ncbi:MAG: fibro-slime domain-containing protein [Clostridiales bacterium]|nr:fibro-slime domain-containing protein [Clostridiales bacterium]
MDKLIDSYVEKFKEKRRRRRRMMMILTAPALLLALVICWQLHLTGVALTGETYCGLEEHRHTEECYETVLVCGQEESEGHTHDESCYDESGNLICGLEELEGHTHTDDCYEEQLACGLEEHTHTEECLVDSSEDTDSGNMVTATAISEDDDDSGNVSAASEEGGDDSGGVSAASEEAGSNAADTSVTIGGTTYETTAVDEFYLWIYDDSITKVAGYSEWDSSSGTNYSSTGITDALSYTDADGTSYYLIPVSYFESALGGSGYTFGSADTLTCPFLYAPSAYSTVSDATSNIKNCLFASYVQVGDTWYVQVTDTTGLDPNRSNIYYNPVYHYEFYVGSYDTALQTKDISNFIGVGNRQVLIPMSCFSAYVSESDLSGSLSGGSLSSSGTITINGESYTTYESDFTYRAAWFQTAEYSAYYVFYNNTWYLLVQDTGTGYAIPVRNKICYTGEIKGVVFSLDNSNGSSTSGDYSDTALRYTVALAGYADDEGKVTVNLPFDEDLNSTFTVVEGASSADTVTVDLGEEAKYDYKLVGWINIATGDYYNVEDGSVAATVDLDDDNVFYADWIADTYDCVGDEGTVIETADTSSFVTIRMFDFSELFNLYSASLTQSGISSEKWSDSGSFYDSALLTNDAGDLTSLGYSFIFFNTGTYKSSGALGLPADRFNWNYWTGRNGTPAAYLDGAYSGLFDEDIISKLYSTSAGNTADDLGTYYVGEANYLFSYDSDSSSSTYGFYSYDSSENAAVYQQSESRFYVYDSPQSFDGNASNSIFLPYNSYTADSSAYTTSNGEINYWFGTSIELNFYLPNDTGTVLSTDSEGDSYGNQINGQDMVFEFSGDDDIWIFVDDELVLDMGGVHSALSGTINFSKGTVTINKSNGTEWSSTTISTLLGDDLKAGSHTMTIYYMERGASDSNLKVSFNVVPEWEYDTTIAGTMRVTKVWENDSSESRPDSIVVGLFEKAIAVAANSSSLTITTDEDGSTVYKYIDGETTYTITDGYSYDSDDLVNAYYSSGYIYVRVDTQTLSEANSWTYTWELLDSSKSESDYEILELTDLSAYTVSLTYTTLTVNDNYWRIAGSDTLNGTVTVTTDNTGMDIVSSTGILEDGLQVVLTDGAQNGIEDSSSFPTTYTGNVIQTDGSTVTTTDAQFSQVAEQSSTDSSVYTYGVTTGIDSSAVWTVEMTGGYDSFDVNGTEVYAPTFYLISSTGKYLGIMDSGDTSASISERYTLQLVDDKTDAAVFSYNALGELNMSDNTGLKIIINDSGDYALVSGREGTTNSNNVKIYVQDSATIGRDYIITNMLVTYELPETGGSGTWPYILIGLFLSGTAMFLLVRRRRRV